MPDKFKIFNRIRYSLIGVFAAVLIAAVIIFAAGFIGSPVVASAASSWNSISVEWDDSVDTSIYPQTSIADLKNKLIVTGTYYDSDAKKQTETLSSSNYTVTVSITDYSNSEEGETTTYSSDVDSPFVSLTSESEEVISIVISATGASDIALTTPFGGNTHTVSDPVAISSFSFTLTSDPSLDSTVDYVKSLIVISYTATDGTTGELTGTSLAPELISVTLNGGTSFTATGSQPVSVTYIPTTVTVTADENVQSVGVASIEVTPDSSQTVLYNGYYYLLNDSGSRSSYYAFTTGMNATDILSRLSITVTTTGGGTETYTYAEIVSSGASLSLTSDTSEPTIAVTYSNVDSTGGKATGSASDTLTLTSLPKLAIRTIEAVFDSDSASEAGVEIKPTTSLTANNLLNYITVTGTYNNGIVSANKITEFTLSGSLIATTAADFTNESGYTAYLTVTYDENDSVTTTVAVPVVYAAPTSITINSTSGVDKSSQEIGFAFDATGTVVRIAYGSGASNRVDFTIDESYLDYITIKYLDSSDNELTGQDTNGFNQSEVLTNDTYAVLIIFSVGDLSSFDSNSESPCDNYGYLIKDTDFTIAKKSIRPSLTLTSQYYISEDEGGNYIYLGDWFINDLMSVAVADLDSSNYEVKQNDGDSLYYLHIYAGAGNYTITVTLTSGSDGIYRFRPSSTESSVASYTDYTVTFNAFTVLPEQPPTPVITVTGWTYTGSTVYVPYVSMTDNDAGLLLSFGTEGGATAYDSSAKTVSGTNKMGYTTLTLNYEATLNGSGGVSTTYTLVFTWDTTDECWKLTSDGDMPTNAGTYYVTATLSGSTNYSDGTTAQFGRLTVSRATLSAAWKEDAVYNAAIQYASDFLVVTDTAGTTITAGDNTFAITATDSYSSGTKVGGITNVTDSVTLTLTLKDSNNYQWYGDESAVGYITIDFAINQYKDSSVSGSMSGFDYLNGGNVVTEASVTEVNIPGLSTSDATVIYITSSTWSTVSTEADVVSALAALTSSDIYTATQLKTADAGTYYAVFYVVGTANYTAAYGAVSFEIKQLTVGLSSNANTEFTYSGTTQSYTVTLSSDNDADVYTLTPDSGSLLESHWVNGDDWAVTIVNNNNSSDSTIDVSGATVTFLNAGTYTVTFTIKDTTNYELTDGNTSFTITITVAQVIVGTVSETTSTTTYNGTSQSYSVSLKNTYDGKTINISDFTAGSDSYWQSDDWSVTISGGSGTTSGSGNTVNFTNAGTYTVTLTINDTTNYIFADDTTTQTITITVSPYQVTKPTISGTGVSDSTYTVTYNGSNYYLTDVISNYTSSFSAVTGYSTYGALITSTSAGYSTSTDSAINAGTYSISVTLTDSANMTWTDGGTDAVEFTLVISPKVVEFTWSGDKEVTYDGSAHTLTATPNNLVDSDSVTVSIEYSDVNINAGTHTATASISGNDNYTITNSTSNTATLTIYKAVITLSDLTSTSALTKNSDTSYTATYDGTTQTLSVSGTNVTSSTVALSSSDLTVTQDALTASFFNAKTSYTLTINISDDCKSNYCWAEADKAAFSSNSPATVTITITVAQYTLSAPTLQSITGVDDKTYTVEYNGVAQNFVDAIYDLYTTTTEADKLTNLTYTSYLNLFTFTTTGEASGTEGSYTQTNAGSYSITVSLSDENFAWSGGTSNPTYTFVIKKATITAPVITIDTTDYAAGSTISSFTYNGATQSATVTVDTSLTTVAISGNTSSADTSTGVVSFINANTDGYTVTVTINSTVIANYCWSTDDATDFGNNSAAKTFTIVVAKYTLTTPTLDSSISSEDGKTTVSSSTYTVEYNATAQDLADAVATVELNNYTYAEGESYVDLFTFTTTGGSDGSEGTYTKTNAGTYSVTVSIANDTNFAWAEGSSDASFTFVITPIVVQIEWGKSDNTDTTQYTYTRYAITPTAKIYNTAATENSEVALSVTVTGDLTSGVAKEVGSYVATASLTNNSDGNYTLENVDATYNYSIIAKEVTAPWLDTQRSLVYNESAQVPTKYYIYVSDSEKTENSLSDGYITIEDDWTVSFTITYKASSSATASSSYDDIKSKSDDYWIVLNLSDSDKKNYVWVSNTRDSSSISAYELSADSISTTNGTIAMNFRIDAATFSLTVTAYSWTYGDEQKAATYTDAPSGYSGTITTTYYNSDGSDATLYNGLPYQAGEYYAVVSWTGTTDYASGKSENTSFKISAYTLTSDDISWANVSFTYDKTDHSMANETTQYAFATLTKTFSNVPSPTITFTYTFSGTSTKEMVNAGSYTVTIDKIYDGSSETYNITLNGATFSKDVIVNRATVATPVLDNTSFDYNSSSHTSTVGSSGSDYNYGIASAYVNVYLGNNDTAEDGLSVSVQNAGYYSVRVELKNKDNYCWLGDTVNAFGEENYSSDVTLYITVKKATVSTPELDTDTFTYNAAAQTATIKNTDASGYNYNIDTSYVKVYLDGAEQTDSISVSVTNAGSYTVTVELKDTANYCWLGEETDPAAGGYATSGSKTLTIKVEKRAITVTITSISSVYGESLTDKAYTVTDGATDYTNLSTMVLDDIKSAIASHITLTHSVEVGTSVGTYVITGSVVSDSDTDKNYNVVFAGDWATEDNNYQKAGTYTVTVRPITVSISDGESVYGNDLESTTAVTIKVANDSTYQLYTADTASNVYGYIITNSSTKGSGTEIDKTYDKGTYYIYGDSNNGNYSITWSYTTVGEYSTYTISARPVAIKVTDTSSTYGSSSYDTAITWQYADDSATFVNPNSSVSEIEKNATTVYDKKADSGYDVSLTTTAVASSDVASYITYLVIGSYSGATYTKNTTYAAGTYTIEMSNYTVTVYIGEHVVKQRAVEITVSGATTTYGDLLATSSLNWSYNSTNKFLTPSGETVSDIEVNAEKIYDTANGGTKDITLATTALQSSDVESYITYLTIADGTASTTYSSNEATYGEGGYYTITMSNYTVKVNIGKHEVEKRNVYITVNSYGGGATSIYGDATASFSWTYSENNGGTNQFINTVSNGNITYFSEGATSIYDKISESDNTGVNVTTVTTAKQGSVVASYMAYLTIGSYGIVDENDGSIEYSGDQNYTAGTYYIDMANYYVTVTLGEYKVTQRSITITIDDVTAIYGTETDQSALTAEVTTNAYDEETETLYTLSANDKVLAGTENVGTYKISATTTTYGETNYIITYAGNYDDEVKGGKFDVTQATLIITPDADSVTYGDDFTASKYTVSGWKNSDGDEGLSTLTVTFGYVTGYEYSQGSPVSGTYTIIITDDKNTKGVVSSDADITNNYYFVYNSDTSGEDPNKTTVDSDKFSAALTVNAREITITFDNKVLYYNLNSSYSYGKQTFAYYGTEGASAGASGYGYTWTAAVTNSSNSSSDAIFSTDYWYTLFTISGGIKTWSDTDLNTADALTTTALTTYDADSSNPYTITGTATGNDGYDASGNYLITFKTATFTINPAQLEINMDGPGNSVYDGTAKVYKATDASGTATFTPVYYRVNDDGTRTLLGEDGKEAPIDVGSYAVTFSATSSTNYQAAGSGTTFNITQATLSVSFTYTWSNDANTAITTTAQYSGYALVATPTFTGICTVRDTADSLNYTITYTGENATDGSAINAGDYTITLTINNGNYFFADTTDSSSASFNIAKQQVSSPVLEKTSDTYQGIQLSFDIATYNTGTDANTGANVLTPALSASSDALEATANLSATAADGVLTVYITNAGTYTVSVTLTNTDNYVWAEGTGAKEYTITINKAALTLTVANQSIIYGEVLSTTAYSFEYTGWVGDDKTSGASSAVVGISNTTQVMGDVVYVVTTYTPSTAAGTSGITISVVTDDPEGLTSTNYTLNVTTGTLTVDKRPITITVNNYSSTYTGDNQTSAMQAAVLADLSTYFEVADGAFGSSGDALSSLGIKFANTSATATNAGDYTFTFTTETDTNTNNYTVTFLNVNAQGDNAKNYLLFTIEQATLYVYVENYTVTYGDSVDGVFTMYYSEEEGHSFVNSETESTAAKTTTSTSNTYSTVLVGGSDSYAAWTSYVGQTYTINYTPYTFSNYDVTVIPGTLTIKAREITLDSFDGEDAGGYYYSNVFTSGDTKPITNTGVAQDANVAFSGDESKITASDYALSYTGSSNDGSYSSGTPSQAGTYAVTVTLAQNAGGSYNYAFASGSTGYTSSTTATVTYYIQKATITAAWNSESVGIDSAGASTVGTNVFTSYSSSLMEIVSLAASGGSITFTTVSTVAELKAGTYCVSDSDGKLTVAVNQAYTYTITLKLYDTNNYEWSSTDDTTVSFSFRCIVGKTSFTVSITGWTYNTTGTSNTPVISNASNFDSGSATFTYYYYTGTVDDFEADFGSGVDINELTITQPTAAGNYVIYAVLVGTESYASSVAYSGFTISRAEVTAPTATGDGSVDYDGTSHSLAVSGYASGTIEYSYSGSTSISGSTITISETNAGEYVITLSLIDDDNYYWSTDDYATDFDNKSAAISFTLIINKVTVTLTVTANNTTYGSVTDPTWSAADELTELVKSAVTVAYTGTTNSSTAYSSSTAPAVAGTYTVTLTLDETNFNLGSSSTTSAEYTINRQAVETAPSIYSGDTDYTKTLYYNTKEQSVTVMNITTNVMTVDGKTAGSMSTTISGTTVGTYTVVIGLADSANYEWASSITTNNSAYNSANYTLTYSLIIDKLALDAPTLSTSSFTYTGSTISVVDYIGGSYDSSIMNYTSATGSTYEAVNVDSYSLIFTLTETTNYKWADPDTESGTTVTVTWEIVKSGSSTTVVLTVTISGWEYGATTTSTPSYTFTDNDEEVNVDSNITYEYYGTSNNGEWSYTNTAGSRSTEAPTLAGTYYVVAILSGHNNYDNITSAACSFTISRATITLSETNGSDTYDGTTKTLSVTGYNSAAIGYEITTNSPNDGTSTASAALNGTTQVDLTAIAAGTYTITFTLTDTANYTIDGTNEFTLTISRQKITVTITAAGGTYNGNAYSATAEANEVSLSGNDFVYTYDGILTTSYGSTDEAPTGAGSYRVTVTLTTANGYNYEFATTQSKEFTIDKASITLTAGTATYTYTNEVNSLEVSNYNSAALSYEITTNNANDGSTDEAKASDSGTTVTMTATKAGEYVLTFTLTDTANYTLDGANAFTLTINRATITLSGEDVSGTYDGDTKSLSIAGKVEDSDLDFDALSSVLSYNGITNNPNDGTSSASAALNGNYQVDLTATAAGTYTITFTLTDTANYTIDGTNEFTLTISRQQITVTITADGGTYSGNAYAATAEVNDGVELLNDSLVYTYVGILGTDYTSTTTAPSGAGYYTVTVTLANGNNYEFADTQSTEFTISKASITLTADETALTYTGSAQGIFVTGTVSSTAIDFATYVTSNNVLSFAASGTGNDGSSKSTAAVNASDSTQVDLTATAAGTYTITFTLTDGDNYTLDGTSAFTLTINRATVALPTATSYSIAYTGSEIYFVTDYVTLDTNYSSIISYDGSGSAPTATEVGNHTVIFVLSSYANYMWAGGSTSDYSMTWTIVSGGVVTIEFTDSTLTYIYGQTIAIEYTVKLGTTTVSGATSTVYYLVDGSYTTAAPSAVGEYTVRVEVDATSEYDRTITTITLTINQQTVTISNLAIEDGGWTYGDTAVDPTYTVNSDVSTYDTDTIGLVYKYYGTATDGTWTATDVDSATTSVPTQAGSYTVIVSLADEANFKLADTYTATFTIAQQKVTVTETTDESGTYTSTALTLVVTYDSATTSYVVDTTGTDTATDGSVTVSATEVGEYTITFSLKDTNNYVWADNTTYEYTLTISAKETALSSSSLSDVESLAYVSNILTATVTAISDGSWVYETTSASDIESHWESIVTSVLGTDIVGYEETTITYLYYGTSNDGTWDYQTYGSTTAPSLAGSYSVVIVVTNSNITFSIATGQGAKAKLASASLTAGQLKSGNNEHEIDLTSTFKIARKGVGSALESATSKTQEETYDGSVKTLTLSGYNSGCSTTAIIYASSGTANDGTTTATVIAIEGGVTILAYKAGTYYLTFSIADKNNYKWASTTADEEDNGTVVYALAIARSAVVVPTMTDATSGTTTKEVSYNGSEQTATITGYSSAMSITTTSDYSISGTTITLKGTSAASYTLTLSISDTNTTNYYWANGVSDPVFTLTISALEVTVTVTADTSTYGSVTVPSVTTSDSLVDSYITVLYTGTVNGGVANGYSSATAPTEAGEYTVTLTLTDRDNFSLSLDSVMEVSYKIEKLAIALPVITNNSLVYTGQVQSATVTGYDSILMTVTGDCTEYSDKLVISGTNVDNYSVTVSLTDTNNYKWVDDAGNPTFTLTINALEVKVTVTATDSTYGSVELPEVTTSNSLVDSYISVLYTGTVNGGTANGYSSATAPTEAGEYTVTLTLTDGDNFSLSSDSVMEVSYKIERLAIALPEISGNVLTYNGAAQSATVTGYDSILMTVTGDCTEYSDKLVISGTNAADYSVTVSLTDTNNYKWVDDAGNPTFTLTINALEVKVTVTATDSTYGNVTVPSIITSTTLVDSYISVLYTGTVNGGTTNGYNSTTAPTQAGTYTVTITLSDDNNYQLATTYSKSYTIAKATITLSGSDASYVYSGSANALTIGADGYNTEGISYSVSSNAYSGVAASSYYNGTSVVVTATDAGTYTLTFKPVDSNNYTISGTTSYTLTISKQTVTVPTASGSTNVTFDGSAHQLVIATYDSKTMSVSGTATASGSSLVLAGTDAGTYTVTISLSDTNNYEWASGGSNPTFTLTITSAGNAISGLANVSTIYGTSYNAETGSANFGTITYLYTGTTNGGVTYSSSVAPTEAGSYTLTATVTGNNNYAGATASITIIIGRLAVALPEISGNVLTYNGAAQSATVTGYDSAVMNVTGDCTEYGNSIVITGTAAGDYSVTVALSDTNNYEWATTGSTTYTLTINALEVTITVTANDSVYGSVELPEVTTSSTLADSNITVLYTGTANDGSAYESATAPTEAGEYSITLTLTDLDNLTLSADSILEASFVIERLAVALPEISGNVLTYNGAAQSATVTGYDSAVMNVTGDCTEYGNSIVITGTAAGDYSVTVALSDTNNYEWATTGSTTYTLTINALEVTITVTANDSVYGSVELPEVTTSSTLADSNITVLYTGTVNDGSAYESATAPTEAGEYSITLTLTDLDNLTLSADSILEASYTIARKVVTLSGEDVTAVYDGTIHTLEVTGYDANAMAYVLDGTSYSGKDATSTASGTMVYVMASDAGEYTLTFELTDANNYTLDGVAEYALTISKATVALPVTGSETAVTYDGTAHLLEISGFNTAAMGYAYSGSVSISGDVITVSETHAGEYAITFSLKDTDNYVWADNAEDPVFSLTIAKATANGIEWSGDILLVYGTSYDAETATATYGNIVYAYYVQGETTALGSAPSDVGVYTVTATVAGTDDYVGATASITITINKAEILIEIPEITGNVLTYTGEAQSATITGYDSKLLGATGEGVDFYVAYNNSIIITETDAGSYTVTVYIIDTLNYMWSDGTTGAKTYTLTINRMAIDTPVTADGNITYDAASHTFTVTGYDAELMSYAYDGEVTANGSELTISATNAGTYTITFGFNTTNYCWSGTGSDEYTISWTIDKLVLTVPTSSSSSFISGNESTYIPEGFDETWMDIEGNTASEAGDYTATVTLKDTENCVWANGTTDSISISWSISHRFTAGHIIMGVIIAILVALLVTLIVRAVIIKKKHSKNEGEENK